MTDKAAVLKGHVSRYGYQKTAGTTQVVIDLHPGQEVIAAQMFGAPGPENPVEVAVARILEGNND